ncbi:uncharacterized protein EI90DRAFT_3150736 [Cantharellus anzutake]|uniref:uncharacterized protein n=1 Tax=Cantharellus anzutake TaxID=1750568 RepID=UPI00190512B3|nr:uncharacterized protein EI90DRAFT_3150736 [Cantharellus anzutake]KAF8340322.1 hypothetical protein EI90DRAFT_3150736 [Cantharellus anzutake]
MSRPLVSYDDIAAPAPPTSPDAGGRPLKRIKRDGQSVKNPPDRGGTIPHPHWDEATEGVTIAMDYGNGDGAIVAPTAAPISLRDSASVNGQQTISKPNPSTKKRQRKRRGARSKILDELPHIGPLPTSPEAIPHAWDDNQLADAWEAANEEYVLIHTGERREETRHKNSRWHIGDTKVTELRTEPHLAVPRVDDAAPEADIPAEKEKEEEEEEDVEKVLAVGGDEVKKDSHVYDPSLTPLPGVMYGENDAFQKAVSASYWLGYWTAIREVRKDGK